MTWTTIGCPCSHFVAHAPRISSFVTPNLSRILRIVFLFPASGSSPKSSSSSPLALDVRVVSVFAASPFSSSSSTLSSTSTSSAPNKISIPSSPSPSSIHSSVTSPVSSSTSISSICPATLAINSSDSKSKASLVGASNASSTDFIAASSILMTDKSNRHGSKETRGIWSFCLLLPPYSSSLSS